jgi:uncharacterized membrane protein YvbJ
MKTCPQCGTSNPEDASKCVKCNSPLPGGGYEFTEEQNRVIGSLASSMGWVSAILVILGLLELVVGIAKVSRGGIAAIIQAAVLLVIAWLTHKASKEFREITTTQGNDVGHLMDALEALRELYRIQVILIVLAVILVFLGIVIGMYLVR